MHQKINSMCIGIILYIIYSSIGKYISYYVGTATPSPSAALVPPNRRANIYYSVQELFIVDW